MAKLKEDKSTPRYVPNYEIVIDGDRNITYVYDDGRVVKASYKQPKKED